jgi:threonine aldolase
MLYFDSDYMEGAHPAIHFLVGGTQTNATVIKALLLPYDGVLSAETGHINIHEAVVITRPGLIESFFTLIKQQGALLAKGRILGILFDTLFTDNLYLDIAKHAIAMAEKLKEGLAANGYEFYFKSPTNQQFIILENGPMNELAKKASFGFWETYDDTRTVVRFATSWATSEKNIDSLLQSV